MHHIIADNEFNQSVTPQLAESLIAYGVIERCPDDMPFGVLYHFAEGRTWANYLYVKNLACEGCGMVDPMGYHYADCPHLESGDFVVATRYRVLRSTDWDRETVGAPRPAGR